MTWSALVLFGIVQGWEEALSKTPRPTQHLGLIQFFNFLWLLVPILALLIVAAIFVDKVWLWMFPNVWFLIGRQAREFEKRAKVRRFIFLSVIGALILSVAGNAIYGLLVRH